MNNITALAAVNGSSIKSHINGAVVRKAPKSGALRLGALRMKEFREMLVSGIDPTTNKPFVNEKGERFTNKTANDAYPAYRARVIADLNKKMAAQLQAGEISIESVGANPLHQLTTATFTKPKAQQKDKVTRLLEDTASAFGLTLEEARGLLSRRANEKAKEAGTQKQGAIEAETRQDAPEVDKAATEQGQAPQVGEARAPEHVATA